MLWIPTLFMRKRKVPMVPERMWAGTTSTTTVNSRENHVSADRAALSN